MHKSFSFLLLTFLGFFSFVSCDPSSQFSGEISTIDSCLTQLDELEDVYNEIDFDTLELMVMHVKENEAHISDLYRPDTINTELGQMMTDAKSVRKRLSKVRNYQETYFNELNELKHQFINLKEDILAGLLAEEEINNYLKTEMAALTTFELMFLDFNKVQQEEKERYDVTTPGIDAFVQKLKEESAQEGNE